jgi:two-component system response regulator GlrR
MRGARDETELTEVVAPTSRHALVREFRLAVVAGPDAGKTHRARRARTVIGTHESADFVLHDRSVSRFHCELSLSGGTAALRDMESRNGTRIDDVPVMHAPLRSGATLAIGRTRLRFEFGEGHVKIPLSRATHFGLLCGRGPAMRAAFALLEKAARTGSTVLIQGETGTGKEIAAESIHRESSRRDRPFVVVDCGAIPANLLETELFGHERGAFTGADRVRTGAFESADGGTVLLDEIGELALDLQPKLLRVLERKEIRRIGSNERIPVDVRVLAATNQDLRIEVNARRFRPDLYYRLAVLEVHLPPLRERKDDLADLVDALLARMNGTAHPFASLVRSESFIAELAEHAWPGNVRELRNYIERCLTLEGKAPLVAATGDKPAIDMGETLRSARARWIAELERRYLQEVLARHGRNVMAGARAAGVQRAYFYRLLARYGLT